MALSIFISSWKHCRPIISIDGTVMKKKYGETLLTAYTLDANEQIFPLAFLWLILKMTLHGNGL